MHGKLPSTRGGADAFGAPKEATPRSNRIVVALR
jgi:hypothetical protein